MKKIRLLSLVSAFAMVNSIAATFPMNVVAEEDFENAPYIPTNEDVYSCWEYAYYHCIESGLYAHYGDDCYWAYPSDGIDPSAYLYDIADLNADGTPELIVSTGGYRAAEVWIYTWSDSKLNLLGYVPAESGIVSTISGRKQFMSSGGIFGAEYTYIYEISNNKLNQVKAFVDTSWADSDSVDYVGFRVNGKKVSETEYQKQLAAATKQSSNDYTDIGRGHYLTDIKQDDGTFQYQNFFDFVGIAGLSDPDDLNLYSITIPDSFNGLPVKVICSFAFSQYKIMTDVILPNTVECIEDSAFLMCSSLKSVTLSKSLKTLKEAAFYGCTALTDFISNSPDFPVKDGVLYTKNYQTLLQYPVGTKTREFIVPDGVKTIAWCAFENAGYLRKITIPESVSRIRDDAFAECSGLADIFIMNKDTVIEDSYDGETISSWKDMETNDYHFDGIIHGYAGSTAEKYAKKYGITFEAINPAVTTAYTTTATRTGTTAAKTTTTTPTSIPEENRKGDVNCDQKVTIADAVMLARIATEDSSLRVTAENMSAADVDEDGEITVFDITTLLKMLAGLTEEPTEPVAQKHTLFSELKPGTDCSAYIKNNDGYSMQESVSCRGDGKDRVYEYQGYTICTYCHDGIDEIVELIITAPGITLNTGIGVGASKADVIAKYGKSQDDSYIINGDVLAFLYDDNDIVTEISVMKNER